MKVVIVPSLGTIAVKTFRIMARKLEVRFIFLQIIPGQMPSSEDRPKESKERKEEEGLTTSAQSTFLTQSQQSPQ
jgi:hypothetical protein